MVGLISLPFDDQDERRIQSLGLAYIAADLKANGIESFVFDGCGVDRFSNIEELLNILIELNPTHVGFYVVEHNFKITVNFIKLLKEKINLQIFLGGPQVVFLADEIMHHYEDVDFILVGESEGKLPSIIAHDYTPKGIFYRDNKSIKHTSLECENIELDKLIFPVRQLGDKCLLTREQYNNKNYYMVPISSSRGCPYTCSFCAVPAMVLSQHIKWRFRSATSVCKEIRLIYEEYKDIYIRFIDDNFLVNINRAMEICRGIRKIGDIPFSFSGRVNAILTLTDEQLAEMKNCGLTAIEIGVENFNDNVLERYQKKNTAVEVKKALKKLLKNDIHPAIDFIMFDPWTTVEELQNNYNAIVELGLDAYDPPFLTNRLYPFPGTEFYLNNAIDIKKYFHNPEIEKIYSSMIHYMDKHQKYREYLLKTPSKRYVLQAFLRLPYKVFSILLKDPQCEIDSLSIITAFEKACYCTEKEI